MVSVCAGCDAYGPWAAAVIAIAAGFVYMGLSSLMVKLKIDDPVDAVAVHLGGGTLGILIAPVLRYMNKEMVNNLFIRTCGADCYNMLNFARVFFSPFL